MLAVERKDVKLHRTRGTPGDGNGEVSIGRVRANGYCGGILVGQYHITGREIHYECIVYRVVSNNV